MKYWYGNRNCYLPFPSIQLPSYLIHYIYFIAHLASQNTHWTCVRLLDNCICAVCSLWLRYLCVKKTENDCHSTIVNALGFCKQDLLEKYYTKYFCDFENNFCRHFILKYTLSITYTCDCASVTFSCESRTANLHPIPSQFSLASFHVFPGSQSKSRYTNWALPHLIETARKYQIVTRNQFQLFYSLTRDIGFYSKGPFRCETSQNNDI